MWLSCIIYFCMLKVVCFEDLLPMIPQTTVNAADCSAEKNFPAQNISDMISNKWDVMKQCSNKCQSPVAANILRLW